MKFWRNDKEPESLTVFTFHTVSEALYFEKALKKEKLIVRLRPVPRMISSSCGTCAVIAQEDEAPVLEAIQTHAIPYHEVHRVKE